MSMDRDVAGINRFAMQLGWVSHLALTGPHPFITRWTIVLPQPYDNLFKGYIAAVLGIPLIFLWGSGRKVYRGICLFIGMSF